jgi:PAS domain S-box-containing protein
MENNHIESSAAKILVVDDTPANLRLLAGMLTEQGYRVRPAKSGAIALSSVQQDPPDLVLLDIIMPNMSGYEVCEQLKADERTRDIPVIFLSAKTDVFDKVKAFELGAVDYITKPFQSEEVVARVQTHLTIRRLQHQLLEQMTRLQTLADAAFEGILFLEDRQILDVNQNAVDLFGYQRAELIGRNIVELMAPESREMLLNRQCAKNTIPFEAQVLRKDGRLVPIEIQTKTIVSQGHEMCVAAMRDLSGQKAMEAENVHLQQENVALKTTLKERYKFGDIIGKSPAMQEVYELVASAAASEHNVVILGESGTGKELVARTIHALSSRRDQAFVPVNCGAITETIFEREFFGHRKGAFTGADRDKPGFFDAAQHGTLFLDEVGELGLAMQVKLLRVLETGEFTPVGDTAIKHADVRLVAATNRDLEAQLEQRLIREDFFYRIHVIEIKVPPLRERREDIPLLIEHFLTQYSPDHKPPKLAANVIGALYSYDWPGNIRELQNKLQRYLATNRLDLKGSRLIGKASGADAEETLGQTGLFDTVDHFEKQLIIRALEQHQGKRQDTADMLQITRRTLHKKMKKCGIP